MRTNDTPILDLMKDIDKGNIQLPDFQRGWVWDDSRIRGLIASITQNFPVGAAMFLEYGNANVRFKYRPAKHSPSSLFWMVSSGSLPSMRLCAVRMPSKPEPTKAMRSSDFTTSILPRRLILLSIEWRLLYPSRSRSESHPTLAGKLTAMFRLPKGNMRISCFL